MEITLEKIELVKDRTGVSYKEAKEALEKTDGNVVDAIIYIEEQEIEFIGMERGPEEKTEILQKIKDVVRKGNVTKIQLKRDDQVILNIPVTAGAIGSAIFPIPAITASIVALAAKCKIEIVKDNGEVVDLNEASGGRINKYRDKAEDAFNTVSEKAGDAFEDLKIKAEDAYESAKYRAAERKERKAQEESIEVEFEFNDENDCEYSEDCNTCDMGCDYQDRSKEEVDSTTTTSDTVSDQDTPVVKDSETDAGDAPDSEDIE